MRKTIWFAVVALLLAFGCGGGSSTTPDAGDDVAPDAAISTAGQTRADIVSAAGHLTGGTLVLDVVIAKESP